MDDLSPAVLFFCLAWVWSACGGMPPTSVVETASQPSEASSIIDKAENAGVFDERLLDVARYDDPQIRIRAARALARIGDQRGCPAVARLCDDDDPEVVEAALFAAGLLTPQGCLFLARSIVSKLSGSGQPEGVLTQAIAAAGRLGAATPWARLVGHAVRGSRATRAVALEALGMAAPELEEGVDEIVEVAEEALFEEPIDVRVAAVFALSRLQPTLSERRREEITGNLESIVQGESPLTLRSEAAVALAVAGRLSPKIVKSLAKQAPDLAARALARYQGRNCKLTQAALPTLVRRLGGGTPEKAAPVMRATAAGLLRACPSDKEAAGDIDELLSGNSPFKNTAGVGLVRCLARYVSGAGDIPLLACDPTTSLTGRQLLAARLAERVSAAGDSEALKSLVEMTRSDSSEVVVASIFALGRVGDGPAREILKEIAIGPAPLAAKAATRALVSAGVPAPSGAGAAPEVRPIFPSEKQKIRSSSMRVRIRTSQGDIIVELFEKIAPASVAAFVDGAAQNTFGDSPVWNVESGDFIRAGDPTGTGLADVSGWIPWEPSEIPFEKGTVGLEGRFGLSSRTRFFISLARHPELDGRKTALGRVVEGLDVAKSLFPGDKIESVEVLDPGRGFESSP